jgi:hypothetical protein
MFDFQVSLHGSSILLVSSVTTLHFFESSTLSATLLASIMMHVLAWLASFLEANFGIWASVIEELVSSSLTSLIAPLLLTTPTGKVISIPAIQINASSPSSFLFASRYLKR